MNNSPLVPTPTVDKNGRQTTVYRRVEADNKSANGIPAPRVSGVRVPVSEEIVNAISGILMYDEGDREEEELRRYLQKLSPVFRETLTGVLNDEDYNFVTSVAANIHDLNDEAFLNEFIRFVREAGINDLGRAGGMVRALHRYPLHLVGGHHDLTKAPDAVQESCSRLLRVTAALEELYEEDMTSIRYIDFYNGLSSAPILANDQMIDLVASDAYATEKILEIIATYRTHDVNAIFGIMNGVEPSLAEGSL